METVKAEPFLRSSALLIDVRSPGEFRQGHIPGAYNLPLFSDQERAQVGTVYRQQGREEALLVGLEQVGPKLALFVRELRPLTLDRRLKIYCARGGMRSASVGWLLELAGFTVEVLEQGYKGYRKAVVESFSEPQSMMILSGKTGSGKTELLRLLADQGEQALDLEGLAHHRGSAFGGVEQPQDFSNEQFWNNLHQEWTRLDRRRRVWLEDEARNLGRVVVPPPLFAQMRESPVIFLEVPLEARLELSLREYGVYDKSILGEGLAKISRRLGPTLYRECLIALDEDRLQQVARVCLDYYDRCYLHKLRQRQPEPLYELAVTSTDARVNLKPLLELAETVVLAPAR